MYYNIEVLQQKCGILLDVKTFLRDTIMLLNKDMQIFLHSSLCVECLDEMSALTEILVCLTSLAG